jgi:hypothetical protein
MMGGLGRRVAGYLRDGGARGAHLAPALSDSARGRPLGRIVLAAAVTYAPLAAGAGRVASVGRQGRALGGFALALFASGVLRGRAAV